MCPRSYNYKWHLLKLTSTGSKSFIPFYYTAWDFCHGLSKTHSSCPLVMESRIKDTGSLREFNFCHLKGIRLGPLLGKSRPTQCKLIKDKLILLFIHVLIILKCFYSFIVTPYKFLVIQWLAIHALFNIY